MTLQHDSAFKRIATCLLILFILAGCGVRSVAAPATGPATLTPDLPTPSAAAAQIAPSITATATPAVTATPTPPLIASYTGYRMHRSDTLETIAARGGTLPELLLRYNRLVATPQIGRELIVPQIQGITSTLPITPIITLRGNTTRPWVALTFDCGGSNPRTHLLLDTLRAAHVHATFFLLGDSIINDPDLLKQMVADGHELGNHSYTHTDFTKLSETEIINELQRTEAAVQGIVGPNVSIRPYFRFPYGAYSREALRTVVAQGYLPVFWTLDSLDAFGHPKTAEFVARRIAYHLPKEEMPGAIILTHCTNATIDAMPATLKLLADEAIEVHTLTEVLGE